MQISARNQIKGTIAAIESGQIMASVKIDIGGGTFLTAMIGKESAADLSLAAGQEVTAIIKSTSIMVAK